MMHPPTCAVHFRRIIHVSCPGEAKRQVEVDVPVGADDGDKVVLPRQGHPSEFKGAEAQAHTPWRRIIAFNAAVCLIPELHHCFAMPLHLDMPA